MIQQKLFPAAAAELSLMEMPPVNQPAPTVQRPRPVFAPALADATDLFASEEWQGALRFAKAEAIDHANFMPEYPTAHRRRARQPYVVDEARALELTGGLTLDLREALRSNDPSKARVLASGTPEGIPRDMAEIRLRADESGFPDQEILDDLEFGALNRSEVQKAVRMATRHNGAFTYPEQVEQARQVDIDAGRSEGPFDVPPIWPCRAVECNVVVQRRPDRTKYRITTDFSECHAEDGVSGANKLSRHPSYTLWTGNISYRDILLR